MVVGSYFPEITGGGLQGRTLMLALRRRIPFRVLATTRNPDLPSFEEVEGIPVHRIHVDHRRGGKCGWSALRLLLVFFQIRKTFNIIHLHGFTRKSLLLVWLGRLMGKRVIYKMTSVGADDVLAVGRSAAGRAALRRVDRFITVSPALSMRYRDAGLPAARLVFIPNGVDIGRFHPVGNEEKEKLRTALGLPLQEPVVVFVGFFSRDKAPQVLVEAWCRIRRQVEAAPHLLLIGSTDPAHVEVDQTVVEEVRRRIRSDAAESHVHFVEATHDIAAYMQASDCFVLSSLREGLPNALMEAMACGVTCLASRLPGVTDLLIDEGVNGLLFRPGDYDDLAGALRAVLRDPSRRTALGVRARATIEQRFAIEEIAALTEQLYHELWYRQRRGRR